jgi:hypothetical protein
MQTILPDEGHDLSWGTYLGLGLIMDDTFVLDFRIRGMAADGLGAPGLLDGQLGVRYQIDVTRWIPSFRLGVGAQVYLGDSDSFPQPHSGAFAEVGVGLLYAVSRTWMIGAEYSHMGGIGQSVGQRSRSIVTVRLVFQREP